MITRVLIVDDEAAFVEALARRLAKREMNVAVALSGPEALAKIEAMPQTDVVILDVKMPEMDGIETLKAIKGRWPLVEVIMLTGHATVESAIEGIKLGAFDYLMKPCDMDVLMRKVKEAKNKKKAHEDKIAEARAMSIALRRGY